jgi:hypothetical protein
VTQDCHAVVVHSTPNRLRIRIPAWRHNTLRFAALQQRLLGHPDILDVRINPLAASIIITCRREFDLDAAQAWFADVRVGTQEPAAERRRPVLGISAAKDHLRALVAGREAALALLAAKLLVALARKQLPVLIVDTLLQAAMRSLANQTRPTEIHFPRAAPTP